MHHTNSKADNWFDQHCPPYICSLLPAPCSLFPVSCSLKPNPNVPID
ncbi:MAG: hypothetical protein F6K55_01585 [Moorea sp. SIO4A3]|nr:hypothetical protein [Moorena sp. SIO4A3]